MPRADDADGDVTGRARDNDALPILVGLLDTNLVPIHDAAPDAVNFTRSL